MSSAWAAEAAPESSLLSLLPIVGIFVVFYFLLIRPQQKRAKAHREMVASITKGAEIVTGGGILGLVTDLSDNFIKLTIAEGVTIQVQRHSVAQMMPKGTFKEKKESVSKKTVAKKAVKKKPVANKTSKEKRAEEE